MCYAAVPLSVDHKPDRSDERQRIEQAGGFVIWAGKFHPIWILPFVFMVHVNLMITTNNLLYCWFIQEHGGLVVFLLFPVHLETSFLSHTLLLTQKFRLAKILSIITHFFMCFYKSYVCKFINPIGYSFGLGGRN
jgi:hypothetical protein